MRENSSIFSFWPVLCNIYIGTQLLEQVSTGFYCEQNCPYQKFRQRWINSLNLKIGVPVMYTFTLHIHFIVCFHTLIFMTPFLRCLNIPKLQTKHRHLIYSHKFQYFSRNPTGRCCEMPFIFYRYSLKRLIEVDLWKDSWRSLLCS